jgi:hypothetical protein
MRNGALWFGVVRLRRGVQQLEYALDDLRRGGLGFHKGPLFTGR